MTEFIQFTLILICMAGTAFYAGIETGMISIHRMRLRHFVRQGLPGADILQDLLSNSDRLLGTTLVGTNLCMVVVSVLSASLAVHFFHHWGEAVAVLVDSVFILIFCEYLPKAWFHGRPLDRCRRFSRLLKYSEIVLRPVSMSIIWLTRFIVPGSSNKLSDAVPFVTREDLKVLTRESEEHGILSPEESVMIHRVFELSGKLARQIMIPVGKVTRVSSAATVTQFLDVARESGFTRMPVFDEEKGKYVGIINVFFVLSYGAGEAEHPVEWYAKPPLLVRESTPVDDILPLMRRFRQPMCLVKSDAEIITGMITTEDILDEIVGSL
ncbi:MAG: CNNM domain-containing protein [Verrucomicrobia bacterium]|nr:CNNM domain-containing protein [Verrucomicrobiota bacterium]